MSDSDSAVIFFKNRLWFLILFSFLDIELIRGEHRRVIGFDDGDDPQNYRRKEKLLNFSPYYCGAKFFN